MRDDLVKERVVKLPPAYVQRTFSKSREYNIINLD